jgi:hypothetical protein
MRHQVRRASRLVALLAIISLAGSITAVPAGAAPAPSAPTLLATSTPGPKAGLVTLKWTAPADTGDSAITTYKYEVSTNAGLSWGPRVDMATKQKSKAVPCSAFPAGSCTYRIFATNVLGDSPASNTITLSATVPKVPVLKATSVLGPSAGNVTLKWVKPTDTGGAAITTFKYEVSTTAGVTWGPKVDMSTTKASKVVPCPALPVGACTYRIYATNAVGDSLASNTITLVASVSNAPVLKTTSELGPSAGNVTLRWAKPTNTGGAPILTYKYERSTNGGTTWGTKVDMLTTGISKVVPCPALPTGSCTYRIYATNALGDSPPSNTITLGASVPGAATLLATSAAGPAAGEATLDWSKPADNGGTAITTFKYELSTDGGATWSPKIDLSTTGVTKKVPCPALPAGSCTYRIYATNAIGDGPVSNPITVSATVPNAPVLKTTSDLGPAITDVTLRWTAPSDVGGAAITTFKYQLSINGGATWSVATDLLTTGSSGAVACPALPSGSCTYRLVATNSVGDSPASNELTFSAVAPSAPALNATSGAGPTVGDVTLRWARPADVGGAEITTYKYDVSTDGGATWGPKIDLATVDTAAVVPCAAFPAGACAYRVYATNLVGDSGPSVTRTLAIDTPSTAKGLSSDTVDNQDVVLQWLAPDDTGGAAVSYRVQISAGGGIWIDLATNLSVLTYTDSSACTSPSSCVYRVVASNAAGDGPVSGTTSFAVAPSIPRSPSVTKTDSFSTGDAAMELSWTNSRSGLVSGYNVEQCPRACTASFGTWTSVTTLGASPLNLMCSAGLTTCSFRIRAVNANGGSSSPWAYFTYDPSAPFGVSAVSGSALGTIDVTFSGPGLTGPADPRFYQFWVCVSSCELETSWQLSPVTVGYPPSQTPVTASLPCPTAVVCSVRAQFVSGPAGRTSMLTDSVSASGA